MKNEKIKAQKCVSYNENVNWKIINIVQKQLNSASIFTEKVNKIAFSAKNDKRIQLIDSTKTYGYGMSKDLACKKEY